MDSGNTHLDMTATAPFETPRMPPYSQPKIPIPETTPTKLRNEITELKSNIAREEEEVLEKLFSESPLWARVST